MISSTPPNDFDLEQIFIGRELQIIQFRSLLDYWRKQVASEVHKRQNKVPSPHDKIQGLFLLLYGQSGGGKSALLRKYYHLALDSYPDIQVNELIDWEFALRRERFIFHPAAREQVDPFHYFNLLHTRLANALAKRIEDFKNYYSAVQKVEDARKQASVVLNDLLQQGSRFDWIQEIAGEGIVALLRFIPHSQVLFNNEQFAKGIKDITGRSVQVGFEQLRQVWRKLHEKLGTKLVDYLEPELALGQGLGHDLAVFARKRPLLIFFDTYEEIDEADELLRVVLRAAGPRVGWVLAGRDNLWAGPLQRIRYGMDTVYGYSEVVLPDRTYAIDFNSFPFTLGDIANYFAQLRLLAHGNALPQLTKDEVERISMATHGVPLAIKIVASLYLKHPVLNDIIQGSDYQGELIDLMVRRFLLQAHNAPNDLDKLYGLALLRRTTQPFALLAAVHLPPQASPQAELIQLHRRYSFIFTERGQPTLHQEVRYFLRRWLLEHRTELEIQSVSQRLKDAASVELERLEAEAQYTSLRGRFEDDRWVETYLDLNEQQFWLDLDEGVKFALPFMFAAGIYRRNANREVVMMGNFFLAGMHQPYRRYWEAAARSLIYISSRNSTPETLSNLEELLKIASWNCPIFFPPLPDFREKLEAALWWRLGEAYQDRNQRKAQELYNKALHRLAADIEYRAGPGEST